MTSPSSSPPATRAAMDPGSEQRRAGAVAPARAVGDGRPGLERPVVRRRLASGCRPPSRPIAKQADCAVRSGPCSRQTACARTRAPSMISWSDIGMRGAMCGEIVRFEDEGCETRSSAARCVASASRAPSTLAGRVEPTRIRIRVRYRSRVRGAGFASVAPKSARSPDVIRVITVSVPANPYPAYARARYSPVSVFTRIMSPSSTNGGT